MKRVPEREAAKVAGERFYHTGKPCRNGHLSKRYTGTGVCAVCATTNTLRCQAKGREHPNRTAARAAGAIHYSTGVACKHGHDRRYVASGTCVECEPGRTKRYRAKTPGIEAKWARERRAKDPTSHRQEAMRWYEKNRERAHEMAKRWKKKNPERAKELARVGANMRRARKAANGGSFTADDIAALLEKQKGRCAGCAIEAACLEIDHIMPIFLGGSSDPTNLQLLCFPCNRSKGRKHPDLWRADLQNSDHPRFCV